MSAPGAVYAGFERLARRLLAAGEVHRVRAIMTAGYFIDWDGNVRSVTDPGGGYRCEVDTVARYVGVATPGGTLVHEATFYRSLEDIARAGIKATLVPGSQPWGERGAW